MDARSVQAFPSSQNSRPCSGRNVKFGVSILFILGFVAVQAVKDNGSFDPPVGSIGLPTGQVAPSFSLTDQFGQEQSNQTLRGPRGTVLLFFRSADW
jgi:cytochrome oxidase Cu insertion factor (SCO1/SenC/PrrC family)